jgi:hypothetical protein
MPSCIIASVVVSTLWPSIQRVIDWSHVPAKGALLPWPGLSLADLHDSRNFYVTPMSVGCTCAAWWEEIMF